YEANQFKDELTQMVRELTWKVIRGQNKTIEIKEPAPEVKKERAPRKKTEIIWEETDCPKCKASKLIKGKTAIGCQNFQGCGFKVPFEIFGKKLTEKQIQDLIKKGKSTKIKGFKSHPEGKEEGVLTINSNGEIVLN